MTNQPWTDNEVRHLHSTNRKKTVSPDENIHTYIYILHVAFSTPNPWLQGTRFLVVVRGAVLPSGGPHPGDVKVRLDNYRVVNL
jgi:hypothetical protein